jgi:hypothetical protein
MKLSNCENPCARKYRLHKVAHHIDTIISSSLLLELRPERSTFEISPVTVLKMPAIDIEVDAFLAALVCTTFFRARLRNMQGPGHVVVIYYGNVLALFPMY